LFGPALAWIFGTAMDPISALAASGLRSRMESLDMLANNMANGSTAGYKADRESYSIYVSPEASDVDPTVQPVIERHWTDFSQGLLQSTGNPLDLALSGKGLFAVNGPSGPLYTRNGSFQLSKDGTLQTSAGYPVRSVEGTPIKATSRDPVEISTDGTVKQKGQILGTLEIVSFPDTAALAKHGNTYFRNLDSKPVSGNDTTVVHQGKIESANVPAAESAVRLVGILRQFEMLQKAITLTGDMNRKAIEEVARVSS
jgi:flagellar basal body rod protein FlgG